MHQRLKTVSDRAWDILSRMLAKRFASNLASAATHNRLGYWEREPFEPLDVGRLGLRVLARPVPWFMPIGRFDQTVFAEAFRQALVEGFAVPRAIELAAAVNPCPIFRRALVLAHDGLCSGYPLGASLRRSRVWIGSALPDALEVGEQFGCLPDALAAFVRQDRTYTGERYRRAIGRWPEATRFAAFLAVMLRDHRLTCQVVSAAGKLAGGRRRFERRIQSISRAMSDGVSFAAALSQAPRRFDPLFCEFVANTDSREELRESLHRLATAGDMLRPSPLSRREFE